MIITYSSTLQTVKMPDRLRVKRSTPNNLTRLLVMGLMRRKNRVTWEKISERILDSMNKRFNLLDHKFETLMNTQLALTERMNGSDHEWRIQTLEMCYRYKKVE